MTGPEKPPPVPGCTIVGLLVGGFAVADFVLPAIAEEVGSPGFAGLVAGGVAGQFGLLSIWAVFGPQRWTRRLPAALGAAVLLFAALFLGMVVAEGNRPSQWEEFVLALLFLPLVFLSAQLLLWIPRYVGGWRIVRAEAETNVRATGSRQFDLRDLLGAMVVLAVSLGLASCGFAGERDLGATWAPLLLGCLVCAAWSAFSTLPCLWACFVARAPGAAAIVIAVYVLVMTAVVLAIGSALGGSGPPGEAVVGVLMFHGGLAGVILGVLCVFRGSGYVLRRAADRRQATPPGIGASDARPTCPFAPSEPHEPG